MLLFYLWSSREEESGLSEESKVSSPKYDKRGYYIFR
jgi:hypothetical protein